MSSMFTALLMSRIWGRVISKLSVAEASFSSRATWAEAELKIFSPKSPRSRKPASLAGSSRPRVPTRASRIPRLRTWFKRLRSLGSSSSWTILGSTAATLPRAANLWQSLGSSAKMCKGT